MELMQTRAQLLEDWEFLCGTFSDMSIYLNIMCLIHCFIFINYSLFGKTQEALKTSKAMQLMLSRPGYEKIQPRVSMICEGSIHHWTRPLSSSLKPLLEGYTVGVRTGDIEYATHNRE